MEKKIICKELTTFTIKVRDYINAFERQGFKVTVNPCIFEKGVYKTTIKGEILSKPFVNDIVDEHIILKDTVKEVLKNSRSSRNNDLNLILEVWRRQGVKVSYTERELELMFNPESITRARRVVQNEEGEYLPTDPSIAIKRNINFEKLTNYYGRGFV